MEWFRITIKFVSKHGKDVGAVPQLAYLRLSDLYGQLLFRLPANL